MAWSVILLVAAGAARADSLMAPVPAPIEHPLLAVQPLRTGTAWRNGLGGFGESLVEKSLALRGYEVINMKLPGGRGIDRIAVKRGSNGILTDVRLIEVKTHYGLNASRLGRTSVGTQMSRQWLTDRLKRMRSAGEPGRKLALEIKQFYKTKRVPIERLGEIHDLNLRTGKYVIRNPVTMGERAGPMSIERHLKDIRSHLSHSTDRKWAVRHLAKYDQLRQARMTRWVATTPTARVFDQTTRSRMASLQQKQAMRGARRGLALAAGRIAIVVAVAIDAYETYGHVREYQRGNLSRRGLIIALSRSGGGIAGAWGGAMGGAWIGAKIGALGGPWAWVTVPAGGFIGGTIGGVAGYFAGSAVGELTAGAWYRSLDDEVRTAVNRWHQRTIAPIVY